MSNALLTYIYMNFNQNLTFNLLIEIESLEMLSNPIDWLTASRAFLIARMKWKTGINQLLFLAYEQTILIHIRSFTLLCLTSNAFSSNHNFKTTHTHTHTNTHLSLSVGFISNWVWNTRCKANLINLWFISYEIVNKRYVNTFVHDA